MKLTTSLPREVVETQLTRIMDSRQFCNAPRLSRFLTYLVEESLASRAERLKGYTIGVEVFDRPVDFDPQTDTIVRVQARALRQKLDQYYAQEGKDDPIHITIPKGSYEPSFYVSWDGNGPSDKDADPVAAPTGKPSIAVLPFDDFSRDGDNAFISHGLTEETIANLSRFKELAVFSRASTEKAKLEKMSVPQIRRAFGADFVLEGSFRISDGKANITINLIDASADLILLTDHFQGASEPKGLYDLQDQLALKIATRVAGSFGPIGQYARRVAQTGMSQKWETFSLISRYHQQYTTLSAVERQGMKNDLLDALNDEEGSSDAHAVLALMAATEYYLGAYDSDAQDFLDEMLKQGNIAVSLDPANARAHEALAMAHYFCENRDGFDQAAKLALQLNPGYSELLGRLALPYVMSAEWGTAGPLLDEAIALSPMNSGWFRVAKSIVLAVTEGPKEAVAEIQTFPLPGVFFYHANFTWFLVELGEMEAAMREKARLLEAVPDFECFIMHHARAWRMHPSITERAFAAWREVGFKLPALNCRPTGYLDSRELD